MTNTSTPQEHPVPAASRKTAFIQRFDEGNDDGSWNDTLALQLAHRSVRKYLDTPVSDEQIRTIVAAAISAASSSNLQMWSVLAVRNHATLQHLTKLADDQIVVRDAPMMLVFLADLSRDERITQTAGKTFHAAEYTEGAILSIVDTAIAAQNAVIAAESLGLGTCYIGSIRNYPVEVAAALKLPPHTFAVFGIVIGYPDVNEHAGVKPRLDIDVYLHQEEYSTAGEMDRINNYEKRIASYYQKYDVKGSWFDKVVERLSNPSTLGNKVNIRQSLEELGFLFQ